LDWNSHWEKIIKMNFDSNIQVEKFALLCFNARNFSNLENEI
jgi:hypothetical protein